MSKRSNVRRRRASRQRQQRNQQVVMGLGALVALGVVVFILAGGGLGSAAPDVAPERLELDPILGNPDAPVTIIEYGAYACPACRQWHQARVVEQILAQYPGQVRFIFRDYPVISPAYDRMAAAVAQCALDQGQEAFWRFHDALYTVATPRYSQDDLINLGGEVGLDVEALRACAEARTHQATVQYDFARGRELGLPGTPSFLVNDQRIFNASPQALQAAVEQALRS